MIAMRRPVIGVLCCNEVVARPVQVVASRFVEPLSTIAGATVLLVPAIRGATDIATLAEVLDGLLLTGSRSNVAPHRYGRASAGGHALDEDRDEVALALAGTLIEAGKPVFGICRGLQEINVLFGGTLSADIGQGRHHRGSWQGEYDELFDHQHDVRLTEGGCLQTATGVRRLTVNSVHEQGIDRLGTELSVEAVANDDGLIEAVAARPCGALVLAVQWHPEWNAQSSASSRAFFELVRGALHEAASHRPAAIDALPASLASPSRSRGSLRGH